MASAAGTALAEEKVVNHLKETKPFLKMVKQIALTEVGVGGGVIEAWLGFGDAGDAGARGGGKATVNPATPPPPAGAAPPLTALTWL